MNTVLSYSIEALGKPFQSDNSSESKLKVPLLQRGSVWRPRQIELLWDSILRGFPIGTLIILGDKSSSDQPNGSIVDGQQRVRAIQAGFSEPTEKSDIIVWIDANALALEKEFDDRQFPIRVTTKAHPWGYNLDGSTLGAQERNTAIEAAGYDPKKPKTDSKSSWDIRCFGPYGEDILPIPFSFFLSFFLNSQDNNLKNYILGKCKKFPNMWGQKEYLNKLKELDFNSDGINNLCEGIKAALDSESYSVPAIVTDSKDNIETLFERIGTMGTQILNKELAFAMMKHYWGDKNFFETNKKLSDHFLPEEDFAQIVFRLYLSEKSIHGEVTPQQIRILKKDPSKRDPILNAYDKREADNKSFLEQITQKVKDWILSVYGSKDNDEYHPLTLIDIATRKPAVYILLLRLALIEHDNRVQFEPKFVQALAFYLHTCLLGDKAINLIYAKLMECYNRPADVIQGCIRDVIRNCISYGLALPITSSFKEYSGIKFSDKDSLPVDWKYENYENEPASYLFERLFNFNNFESSFMLLLAERHFFITHYPDYSPSGQDLWRDLNRPWDHDHIVPKSWIGENEVWTSFCNYWINSVGNIADIPFELNRQKNADANWSYYEKDNNCSDLLFERGALNILDKDLATDENKIKILFNFVRDRFLKISDPFLAILNNLELDKGLSEIQSQRKQLLMQIKKSKNGCCIYYLHRGKEYVVTDEDDNFAWQQPWLSVSYPLNERRVIAFTTAIYEDNGFNVECGLRRNPSASENDVREWWEPGSYKHAKEWPEWEDGEKTTVKLSIKRGGQAIIDGNTFVSMIDSQPSSSIEPGQ